MEWSATFSEAHAWLAEQGYAQMMTIPLAVRGSEYVQISDCNLRL